MEKTEQFKKDALSYPEKAKQHIVRDNETLSLANNFILTAKEMLNEVAGSYDPIIKHAQAEKKKYSDPLKEAMGTARLRVTAYLEKLAEIKRKADEEAREKEQKRQKKEDDALEKAQKLRDKGKDKKAEAILEKIPLPEPVEWPELPQPKGLSLKRIVDTEKINRFVATKHGQARIPGIRIYPVWRWEIENRSLIPSAYYKSTSMHRGGP